MPDDQVTIDPEFQPSPSRIGPGRWFRLITLAVAAFLLGWLFRSPTLESSKPQTSPSTTAPTGEATSTTRPATTTTTVPETIGLPMPLEEALPGFTDIITMAVRSEAGTDLMRWWPSQSAPEMTSSLSQDWGYPAFAGFDASGSWYAVNSADNGVLNARPVTGPVDEAIYGWGPPSSWSPAWREPVGLRVTSSAWHESEPGRLAWLTCSRELGGAVTLYTLSLIDSAAEAVALPLAEGACGMNTGVHLAGWGDWGFLLLRWEQDPEQGRWEDWAVLLDVAGTEIATLGDNEAVFPGPGGMLRTEWSGSETTSYVVSSDGQLRRPVPGLADYEWVEGALWSPDGSRIAIVPFRIGTDHSSIRVVDIATDTVVAEISGREPWPAEWSADGRFLFYHLSSDDGDAPLDWVVYDTATGVATDLPVPEGRFIEQIRSSKSVPFIAQLTPTQWGIVLDGGGPGIHTVFMELAARPLTPDQVESVSGRLIWEETVVDLCGIAVRGEGDGFVDLGDIFQTTEGCGDNPTAMQDAFNEFGLPETACIVVTSQGFDHQFCAPLT